MLELYPSNKKNTQYKNVQEEDSLNWKPNKKEYEILWRKGFKCECCGFVSKPHKIVPSGYMEIVKTAESKTTVLCCFCSQSQQLGRAVNGELNHGKIVFLPELSQGQTSLLCMNIYADRQKNGKSSNELTQIYRDLNNLRDVRCSEVIPDFQGDVKVFVSILENLPTNVRVASKYNKIVSSLRYVPSDSVYKKQISFWRQVVMAQ